jgi:hypothetical protein
MQVIYQEDFQTPAFSPFRNDPLVIHRRTRGQDRAIIIFVHGFGGKLRPGLKLLSEDVVTAAGGIRAHSITTRSSIRRRRRNSESASHDSSAAAEIC